MSDAGFASGVRADSERLAGARGLKRSEWMSDAGYASGVRVAVAVQKEHAGELQHSERAGAAASSALRLAALGFLTGWFL